MIARLKNAKTGIIWTLRFVPIGGVYGRTHSLTNNEIEPLIEFYDFRHKFETSPNGDMLGQFVSRYHAGSLLDRHYSGLCLDGGVSDWNLDAETMHTAKAIIENWLQA